MLVELVRLTPLFLRMLKLDLKERHRLWIWQNKSPISEDVQFPEGVEQS